MKSYHKTTKKAISLSLLVNPVHLSSKPLRPRSSRGFTIVELLIVIVVIGILAAISIVAYSGISNNANDAAVQSDFTNFAKKYELIRAEDSSGKYSNNLTAAMGFSFTKGAYVSGRNNMYLCVNPALDRYAIAATSRSAKSFRYDSANGKITVASGSDYASTCTAAATTASTPGSYATSAYRKEGDGSEGWAAWAN